LSLDGLSVGIEFGPEVNETSLALPVEITYFVAGEDGAEIFAPEGEHTFGLIKVDLKYFEL
jgi:hypothetical protein